MLLVAITGPVGSEKSRTLSSFTDSAIQLGYEVDGFVSVAGERPIAMKGASDYTLHWVKSGIDTLFAHREGATGYVLEPATLERLSVWSQSLASQDLIVLDELGKWEAEGNGLVPYWEAIEKSSPRMVCVTLRDGVQVAVERHLGRSFDLVLPVDGTTEARLVSSLVELRDWERIGVYGAGSGGIEWSVGSWLHASKFPFTGTVMGSLQASVLALVSEKLGRKSLTVWVSLIAAGIKAVSPAGSRITPTIAIVVQGFLFTVGAMVLRWSRLGIAFGAFLVGVWAALQGFFIQYLLLGKSLEKAWDAGIHWLAQKGHFLPPSFWQVALALAGLNGCISAGSTLVVTRKQSSYRVKLEAALAKGSGLPSPSKTSPLRDLLRPMFWLPLVLVSALLLFAKESPMNVLWMVLRASAVVLALGGIFRSVRADRMFDWMRRRGQWGPAVAMNTAQHADKSPPP